MKRPAIVERLRSEGAPTPPRSAASVIVARDGEDGIEVLLVQRSPAQRFMGGFWVFPGGAVDAGEDHRAAAVRELAEEAAVTGVAPGALVSYSHWITPERVEIRFDTRFFVVRMPQDAVARIDGAECVDLRWLAPRAAVAAHARGELALVLPTLAHLQDVGELTSVDALLAHARERVIEPILPRLVFDAGEQRILLPGEPGYDAP